MLKAIFGILMGMLLVVSVLFGKLIMSPDLKAENSVSAGDPRYHLQLIVQGTEEYFWTLFQQGASAAAKEHGVYVEFVSVPQKNTDDLRVAVEMGVNSGVDGIALQAADSEQTSLMIEDAKEHGVAVLAYENDNYLIPNTPMVGTNSFSLGSIAGDMAVEATKAHANAAVIISNAGDQGDVQYKNMIVQGVLDSFSGYGSMNLDFSNIYMINTNMFEAERIASSIIEDTDKVDLIICFDESSTPGIAQMLVDNNMVGDIRLIGYGNIPQTLDYIERGVIYGTVCPNAYDIGYYTVKQLTESLQGEQISDSISTELYKIDRSNVKKYRTELEQVIEGA